MAINCADRNWRADIRVLPGVQIADFRGPNLTELDFAEGEDWTIETLIQGEFDEAQREGWSHVLIWHGDAHPSPNETTMGHLVRREVLRLISWDVLYRAKCRFYKDAVLVAIRPPLSEAERDHFDRLVYRLERRAFLRTQTDESHRGPL